MDYKQIIKEMTLEEKFHYLTGADMNAGYKLDRFPIETMRYHDGPFGLRMKEKDNGRQEIMEQKVRSAFPNAVKGNEVPSTAFPTGCSMGATWDEELIQKVGNALGEEYSAYGINAILGPAMNIKRHPLCGRNFEYFSEDPYLSGKLGSAYVNGVQEKGVGACPKHFVANNQENGRADICSEVDERTLREIYLRPFEIMVKESAPWSIMCSYNRLNGVFAAEHKKLLVDILREEWGFDGIIISDWGSVKNRAYSLLASVEMCMPYQEEAYGQLQEAYESGIIDDEVIDEALARVFDFYERTKGIYETTACNFEEHHEIAVEAANKSFVLLKNENQALPLDKNKISKLLVIGEGAVKPYIGGDGSSRVANPTRVDIPLEELRKELGNDVDIAFMGIDKVDAYNNEIGPMETEIAERASESDAVIVFATQNFACHSEAIDRSYINLPPNLEHSIKAARRVNDRVIVVLNTASAISTDNWGYCAQAILVSWLSGQGMGRAIAETLTGKNNPSGKLPETFPKHLRDVKSLEYYPGDRFKVVYEERMMVGYRHFDTNHLEPAYEFGFGLSYSEFKYSNLSLQENKLTFEIENVSDVDGEEVAQVYVEFPDNSWNSHPLRELKAFKKVMVPAHSRETVQITLSEDAFSYYSEAFDKWTVEDGIYRIHVGSSSRKLPLCIEKAVKQDEYITNAEYVKTR